MARSRTRAGANVLRRLDAVADGLAFAIGRAVTDRLDGWSRGLGRANRRGSANDRGSRGSISRHALGAAALQIPAAAIGAVFGPACSPALDAAVASTERVIARAAVRGVARQFGVAHLEHRRFLAPHNVRSRSIVLADRAPRASVDFEGHRRHAAVRSVRSVALGYVPVVGAAVGVVGAITAAIDSLVWISRLEAAAYEACLMERLALEHANAPRQIAPADEIDVVALSA